jgi:hypothetical protein
MRGAVGVAVVGALASWAWEPPALADASRVVIVRDRSADAVVDRAEIRLGAELRAAGFLVEERVVDGDEDARKIVETSEDGGPFATVLLRRAGARAATDVWVADHVTHKTVVRRMGSRGSGDAADRALALRVVELMRASLVEGLVLPPSDEDVPAAVPAAPSAAPPPPAPPPPPDVARWTREAMRVAPPSRRHVAIALGVEGAFAGPDVGLAVAPVLRVAWRATDTWSLGVLAAGPGYGARVSAAEGSANLRQELALAEVAFEPPTAGTVGGFATLGAGAYHLYASGDATAPFTSGQDEAWAVLLGAGGGLKLRLSPASSIVLDVREVIALPRPVVVFAATQVGTAMRPGTLGGISLALDL